MQDRFKFRVWLEFENKMITPENESFFALNQHGSLLKINDKNEVCWARIGHTFSDDNIMQCTGLKDKNGKLIYEGDIVRFSEHYVGDCMDEEHAEIIEFEQGSFNYALCNVGYQDGSEWCEIIGNVYENPELLEENSEE